MKKRPIHIIYLPGFGGKNDHRRLTALKWWRYRDVTVEFVPMRWEGKETFDQKLARIDQAIDRAEGKRIVIIGESAAGSMAVHTYARHPDELYKVMTICGKNNHPETVNEKYYEYSPVFRTAMEQLKDSTNKLSDEQCQKFVSIHPLYDPLIPVRETLLPGCRQVRLWAIGHNLVISLALTILSPIVVRAARK